MERKVGYVRANLFVPEPKYTDIVAYNKSLLAAHEIKAAEDHYKKAEPISSLFEKDKAALMPLTQVPFNVVRYSREPADGYGKICLDGKHFYSTCPEFSGKKDVLIGIRAYYIDVYSESGSVLVRHLREFGDVRTDKSDYSTTVTMLMHRPGAWLNSGVRQNISDPLREYMDHIGKTELRSCLSLMNDLTDSFGFEPAVMAMDMALRDGRISQSDARIIAARITGYGIDTPPVSGSSLLDYDNVFLKVQKGGAVS